MVVDTIHQLAPSIERPAKLKVKDDEPSGFEDQPLS